MKTDCKNYTHECEEVYCNECGKWEGIELIPYSGFVCMAGDAFNPEQIARLYDIYEIIIRQVRRELFK